MEYPHAHIKNLVFSFQKHNVLYFRVPKVASTSLLITFRKVDEVRKVEDYENYPTYESYFKFAFVRNPFDRLVSCFKHVIQKGSLQGIQGHPQLHRYMTFEQFVDVILKIKVPKMDIHFRPQHAFIPETPDFLGKFENLQEDYPKVCKLIGIKNPAELMHTNSTDNKNFKDIYTPDIVRKVAKIYRKDFEQFGYSEEINL